MSISLYDGRQACFRIELFHIRQGNEDDLILATSDELGEVHKEDEWDEEFEDEELKALLTQQLLELEQLAGNWPSTIEERHVTEREIGRQCYQTAP